MFKSLTPNTKCLIFFLTMLAAIFSYDSRFLGVLALIALLLLRQSKLKFSKVALCLIILHLIITYLKNPNYGVTLYQYDISWLGDLTLQEGLYLAMIALKDVTIVSFLQLFLQTSYPSELSASLSQLGIPSRLAYQIGRLFWIGPNFNHRYEQLKKAGAAQGLELSKFDVFLFLLKARQTKSVTSRHVDKKQTRTWYYLPKMSKLDRAALLLAGFSVIISMSLWLVNGGRLWNPFK